MSSLNNIELQKWAVIVTRAFLFFGASLRKNSRVMHGARVQTKDAGWCMIGCVSLPGELPSSVLKGSYLLGHSAAKERDRQLLKPPLIQAV